MNGVLEELRNDYPEMERYIDELKRELLKELEQQRKEFLAQKKELEDDLCKKNALIKQAKQSARVFEEALNEERKRTQKIARENVILKFDLSFMKEENQELTGCVEHIAKTFLPGDDGKVMKFITEARIKHEERKQALFRQKKL